MRLLIVLLTAMWAAAAAAQERVPLAIETADGARHAFQVEIADSDPERSRGLMYRQELAPDHGMLFVFERTTRIAMWMKNTPLPLDMLFAASDGRIVDIHERAIPHSLDTIAASRRARYVLEVNGGTVDRLGLAVGDRLVGAGIGGG